MDADRKTGTGGSLKTMLFQRPWDVLTEESASRIHRTSVSILEKTGLHIDFERGRFAELARLGLDVDIEAQRVRFPRGTIGELLKKAPKSYSLHARNPSFDIELDGCHGYLCLDGSGTSVSDIGSGIVRDSSKRDLEDAVRVADALPQISYLWPCLCARDKPGASQPLHELDAMLNCSSKHAQPMTAVRPDTARACVEMAAIAAGGLRELRERPIISTFVCSRSPLCYEGPMMEAAFIYAEYGVPCGFLDMTIGCATAPATLAGSLAQGNAEVIGGMAILELLFPGAKTFYGSCATVMDLRTGGATCGGPEDVLLQAASAQMARFYGVPSMVGTFATGAKRADWQAGVENTLSGVVSTLAGAELMCGAGMLKGATVFSFEQLVKDCEIFDICSKLSGRFEINADTLAEDVIADVGPDGHFLVEEHTIENMRAQWQTSVFDRSVHDSDAPRPDEKANAIAREILSTHRPLVLEKSDEIKKYIEKYESDRG
jgi:trimethylamine--corrinoid protein Co-methyltransferase